MLQFFDYGKMLLETISAVGDFLLSAPSPSVYGWLVNVAGWLNTLGLVDLSTWFGSGFTPSITIAGLLFGSGVVAFLIIRLVKFFTNFL